MNADLGLAVTGIAGLEAGQSTSQWAPSALRGTIKVQQNRKPFCFVVIHFYSSSDYSMVFAPKSGDNS